MFYTNKQPNMILSLENVGGFKSQTLVFDEKYLPSERQ